MTNGQIHLEIQEHIALCKKHKEQYCGVLAPWGHGKCFVKGELVDTFDGLIPIEEVRAGNKVYSYNFEKGKASYQILLTDAFFSGDQECLEIEFSCGQKQKVSGNHPYWINGRSWVEARYLNIGDQALSVLNYENKFHSPQISSDEAWLCGLYIGDGSYGKISCGDKLIVEYLNNFGRVKKVGPYEYYLTGIRDIIRKFNIDPDQPKRFPTELFKSYGGVIQHFIGGYFDADGTISAIARERGLRGDYTQICIELYSIQKDWLLMIQNLLHYFGIRSIVSMKNGKYKGERHESWRLTIRDKKHLARFRKYIPLHGAKRDQLNNFKLPDVTDESFYFNEIKSIKSLGVLATYGIEVPITHNHVFNGILSHNTENAIIGNTLDEIGKNRNIRIFIISNTDDNAKARIESLTNYIGNDVDYHRVYPDVRPSNDQSSWTKHKFVVERESKAKDGTVEAYGVMTSGVGGRCDLLLFDDPVDMRNAIMNPALREQVKQNIENVWLSRLTPDGMAIYIATIWHQDDATSNMLNNPKWKFLVMRISEDYESIECESPFKGKYKIPLWSYWNKERLLNRLGVIGQRAFNRGFRQNALSDEDRTFPSSDKIFRHDVDKDSINRYWPRICGIDPFGQWVVIYTIALNPQNNQRITTEIRRGRWQPRQTINEIVDVWHKQKPQIMVVENNASQDAIIQWAHEIGGLDMPIVPFTTGAQKANIDFGLPSLEVEFANGAWMIPCRGIDFSLDHENPIVVHSNELRGHPVASSADTVMAQWFAREGARFLSQQMHEAQSSPNEIITGEEIGIERVVIGNY